MGTKTGDIDTQAGDANDANSGATRTGTLAIARQTITITQADSSFVPLTNATTLVSSNTIIPLYNPCGVAVDGVGNVYIADIRNNAIKEWTEANGNVITLVS